MVANSSQGPILVAVQTMINERSVQSIRDELKLATEWLTEAEDRISTNQGDIKPLRTQHTTVKSAMEELQLKISDLEIGSFKYSAHSS